MAAVYFVPLRFTPNAKQICLRQLTGNDELSVEQPSSIDAILLLDRLLADVPTGFATPNCSALQMVTADRDQAMAAIYKNTFGNRISSTINCAGCSEPFDLDFLMDDLQAYQASLRNDTELEQLESGVFRMDDNTVFRLPIGEDEAAVSGMPRDLAEKQLLSSCMVQGDVAESGEAVESAMQSIAPIFALDLAAKCPECGLEQAVHFDVQAYLISAILNRRKQLLRDVHRLASAYGWSHLEILSLPSNLRRVYSSMVASELEIA